MKKIFLCIIAVLLLMGCAKKKPEVVQEPATCFCFYPKNYGDWHFGVNIDYQGNNYSYLTIIMSQKSDEDLIDTLVRGYNSKFVNLLNKIEGVYASAQADTDDPSSLYIAISLDFENLDFSTFSSTYDEKWLPPLIASIIAGIDGKDLNYPRLISELEKLEFDCK